MDAIRGQTSAIEILQAALGSDRLHHAYIFHGPVGVGKCTTARALARIILCPHAQANLTGQVAACGACNSCQLLESDNHPDLHVIRKELAATSSIKQLRDRRQMNIPVDLLREHVVGGTTMDGKYHEPIAYKTAALNHNKVFIIDEAELLDPTGQNAMLKTLEEPPAGTFFILICANEDRLLPTVRSRSQRVAFTPLDDSIVADWLASNQIRLEGDLNDWLIGFADGSLGRAKLVVDFELHTWARLIRPALRQMPAGRFDPHLGATIGTMIDEFAENWVSRHDNASKDAANKLGVRLMWSMIAFEAREQIAARAADCEPNDPIASETALNPWLGVIDALDQAQRQISSNVSVKMVCDNLVSVIHRQLTGVSVVTS